MVSAANPTSVYLMLNKHYRYCDPLESVDIYGNIGAKGLTSLSNEGTVPETNSSPNVI